jgi:3-phenylpropionate/trans-cinnamate dioxygenase ferredoxin subunit
MNAIEVAKVNDIPVGAMKSFTIEGKQVLVANVGGKFYALNGKCTHMGGDLSRGKLEGNIVTCPRHGSKFDVISGECISGPKMGIIRIKVKDENTYEVQIEGNAIKVKLS